MIDNNRRILIIDDNETIHKDFQKILGAPELQESFDALKAEVLGVQPVAAQSRFELQFASQGKDGCGMVEESVRVGRRFAVAFVDVRMPPGWDGIETTSKIWEIDPDLQVVICTAYSDCSWEQMIEKIGQSDRFVILKKPFDNMEVLQMANALTEKWNLHQKVKMKISDLEGIVGQRTEQLRHSEERFRNLCDFSPLGVIETDERGQCRYTNRRVQSLFGRPFAEHLGDGWLECIHPDDRETVWEFWNKSRTDEKEFTCEHRILTPDGEVRWVKSIATPIFSGSHRKLGYVGILEEITERKRIEKQLHEQACLLDLASDAISVRDLEGKIQFWNKGAERLYGWTAAEAIMHNVAELIYSDGLAYDTARKVLLQNGEWHGEFHNVTKSGIQVIVNSRWTLLRRSDGEPKSVLSIDTDVTEKKTLEAQFLRAQRMEAIGTLASGVAHDLNNILVPILMSVPLLRLSPSPEEYEALLEVLESSGQRAASIIKQVLTFARGVQGERITIQPRELIKEVVKIATETFPKNITIQHHIAQDIWPIVGDSTQLHQVLLNLCVNARDAMPRGGTLFLKAENLEIDEIHPSMIHGAHAGPHVVFQITDTGTGIPLEVRDRIFDPFFTTKPVGKGTGLGLSTVLGIVKSHGGFVQLESETDKGTSFKVSVPAAIGKAAPKTGGSAPCPRGCGEVILVVDDEANIREMTQYLLKRYGYAVLVAENGAEAVRIFAEQPDQVSIVLTDMNMPVMDGLTLVRDLKKIKPEVQIIASSGLGAGSGFQSRVPELQALGVGTCLSKPYSAERLLTAIRNLLKPETQSILSAAFCTEQSGIAANECIR